VSHVLGGHDELGPEDSLEAVRILRIEVTAGRWRDVEVARNGTAICPICGVRADADVVLVHLQRWPGSFLPDSLFEVIDKRAASRAASREWLW
jgi:hypothetical protein